MKAKASNTAQPGRRVGPTRRSLLWTIPALLIFVYIGLEAKHPLKGILVIGAGFLLCLGYVALATFAIDKLEEKPTTADSSVE